MSSTYENDRARALPVWLNVVHRQFPSCTALSSGISFKASTVKIPCTFNVSTSARFKKANCSSGFLPPLVSYPADNGHTRPENAGFFRRCRLIINFGIIVLNPDLAKTGQSELPATRLPPLHRSSPPGHKTRNHALFAATVICNFSNIAKSIFFSLTKSGNFAAIIKNAGKFSPAAFKNPILTVTGFTIYNRNHKQFPLCNHQ